MAYRKHISWKTRCAAALASSCPCCGHHYIFYDDCKVMTEDQYLSLFHWDHNMFHESGNPDIDKYWNLSPMLIKAHREKTKRDATVIAKGRRIRAWNDPLKQRNAAVRTPKLRTGTGESKRDAAYGVLAAPPRPSRKIRSRGFDKSLRKKMDGTVVKRPTK